ncbi:protein [Bifidobacterium longum subsp. longum CECT 7347]|nr:protein [Bifidobacterium longum subsp. longum CECT 7347]
MVFAVFSCPASLSLRCCLLFANGLRALAIHLDLFFRHCRARLFEAGDWSVTVWFLAYRS